MEKIKPINQQTKQIRPAEETLPEYRKFIIVISPKPVKVSEMFDKEGNVIKRTVKK